LNSSGDLNEGVLGGVFETGSWFCLVDSR
jgi:hypothetical protein